MGRNSAIEWTDHTFNPWIGCSMGCGYCYAERMNRRLQFVADWRVPQLNSDAKWDEPRRWNAQAEAAGRPIRVFCGSMCDVFDPQLPDPWRHQVDQLIHDTPHLRWLLLTKRPEQMQRYIEVWWKNKAPRQNVWLGVSVTNQADANARVPLLLETPAAGRFVSCEPLVGAVDLRWWLRERYWEIEQPAIPGLDWVIAGGMSGPDAVPTHPDWVRSLRDQCATADVPFLFKQWGEWYAVGLFEPQHRDDQWFRIDGAAWRMRRRGKKAAGRVLDGKVWDQVPEWKGENDEGC